MSHCCPLCNTKYDLIEKCNDHLAICDVNMRLDKSDRMLDIRDWELDVELINILKKTTNENTIKKNSDMEEMTKQLRQGQFSKKEGNGDRIQAVESFVTKIDEFVKSLSEPAVSGLWLQQRLILADKYNVVAKRYSSAVSHESPVKIWRIQYSDKPSTTTRIRQFRQNNIKCITLTITALPGNEGSIAYIDLPNETWQCTNPEEQLLVNKIIPHTGPLQLSKPSVLTIEIVGSVKWLPIRVVSGTTSGPALNVPIQFDEYQDGTFRGVRVGAGVGVEATTYTSKKERFSNFVTALSRKRRLPSYSAGPSVNRSTSIEFLGPSQPVTEISIPAEKRTSRMKLLTEPIPVSLPPNPCVPLAKYLWHDHQNAEAEARSSIAPKMLAAYPSNPALHLRDLRKSFGEASNGCSESLNLHG